MLRRAVADLTTRERSALAEQSGAAAQKWSGTLPRVSAVWRAFAHLVAEIDDHERARNRSDAHKPRYINHARK